MQRSFGAVRVSNKFDLPIHVSYDRIRSVPATKAAIGRLTIVSTRG
jgi:hypothetical protein